ncbi:TPA: restriction endonuclease subunit S, partial [Klebsiella quasipneumoniae]|nr:restriction endonuclease subunit S [Klebsiella quasipneumoniae]
IDACFPDSIVGFIPYEEKANVIFIKYLIDVNKDYLEASAPATAQKNINLKVLSELKILLPSIEEQNRIVILVEDTLSQISFIERTTNDALNRVNHLTQSILAKAFRGELTAQWREENPELISGLNSAEALLEKITAEKLAAGTLKKRAEKTSH